MFLTSFRLFAPGRFPENFAVIVAPTTAVPSVTLNGQPISGFAALPGGAHEFVIAPVPDGESVINAAEPIGVYSIGFEPFDGYGYPTGF